MFWGDFSFRSGRYPDELGKLRQFLLDNLVLGDYATQTAGAAWDQFCKVEQLAAPDPVPIAPDEPKPALPAFAIGDPALQVRNHIEVSEGPRYQHAYKYLDAVVPDAAQAIIQAEMWVEAHLPAVGELVAEYEMLSTKKMRLADGTALATWDSRVYYLEQSETGGGNDPRNVSILAGHYAAGAFWNEVYAEVETFWRRTGTGPAKPSRSRCCCMTLVMTCGGCTTWPTTPPSSRPGRPESWWGRRTSTISGRASRCTAMCRSRGRTGGSGPGPSSRCPMRGSRSSCH